jgi:hypothetical protein
LDVLEIKPEWPHFGRSLVPVLSGAKDSIRDAVFADAGVSLGHDKPESIERSSIVDQTPECCYYPNKVILLERPHPVAVARSMMIRTAHWKYIWRQEGGEELYDLDNDPKELTNLLAIKMTQEIEEVKCSLQERLLHWHAETGDVLAPPNA